MYDETVTLLGNGKVNEEYFKLSFRSKRLSGQVKPGQFLHLKIDSTQDPFLRRPFSYYRVTGERIEVLYEILGRGTALLARYKKGDTLRIMGPLGREFSKNIGKRKRILVGGGVGVPPLVFLAEEYGCDRFFIGAKSHRHVLPPGEIKKIRKGIFYTTNDGSYGMKGLVTILLENLFEKEKADPSEYFIQTCGPTQMMERVMEIANRLGVTGEASWEERMACGVGVCLGCMVHTRKGWTPSCTEGPVFGFDEMVTS